VLPAEHFEQRPSDKAVEAHLKLVQEETELPHLLLNEDANVQHIGAKPRDLTAKVRHDLHNEHDEQLQSFAEDDVLTAHLLSVVPH